MISLLDPKQDNGIPDFPFGNLNIDYACIYLQFMGRGFSSLPAFSATVVNRISVYKTLFKGNELQFGEFQVCVCMLYVCVCVCLNRLDQ